MCLLMLMMVEDGPRADGLHRLYPVIIIIGMDNEQVLLLLFLGDVSSSLLPVCTIPSPIPSLDGWG